MENNLIVKNTGLEHLYINGVPIVDATINMADVYKKVARISSLAVQADPYFMKFPGAMKIFSESHGEGDRITRDFLEEGARDVLPVFQSMQRWIPEGVYDAEDVNYEFPGNTSDFEWTNPKEGVNSVVSINACTVKGSGDLTFYANYIELGTISLPTIQGGTDSYIAYDIAAYLGGEELSYIRNCYTESLRNVNKALLIEARVTNASDDFEYDIIIKTIEYDGVTWNKALLAEGDVKLPSIIDNVPISFLSKSFTWNSANALNVYGVTLKKISGYANITINTNAATGTQFYFGGDQAGESFSAATEAITSVSILVEDASDDFCYDLAIETSIYDPLPSPRFEFDSSWNPNDIIYRWQLMDTRLADQKNNYTSETLRDIRIDTNTISNVRKYLADALKDYVLKELYRAIGYDKKYIDYNRSYNKNRQEVAFWAKNDKSLQTQYNYAGV